jgi:peptide/nickel transport system substrate-binding protein
VRKPFLSLVSGLAALAVLLAACSSSQHRNQPGPRDDLPVRGGTLTIAATQDALLLNPLLSQDSAANLINRLVFDSLLRQDDQLQFRPGLAESLPEVTDGGRKWTFRLRRDVKFHDGQLLTSKDVRFTFEALFHPGHAGARTSNFDSLRGAVALRHAYQTLLTSAAEGKLRRDEADRQAVDAWEQWRKESGAIQTPDPYTVIFTLDVPSAPTLAYVASLGILPEDQLKDDIGIKMKDSAFGRSPVGSGRYVFGEWRPGDRIVLKANDSWWGGRPNIDSVVWRIYPSNESAMAAVESGEADSTAVRPASAEHFTQQIRHVRLIEYATTAYSHVALDLNSDLFRDVRVRQALALAVDRDALIDRALGGHGTPAWSHATPSRWDYNPDLTRFAYNPSQAVILLDKAGWVQGGDGIRVNDGKRFAFTLTYTPGQPRDMEIAQFLQTAWRAVGADVAIRAVDDATLLEATDTSNRERKQPQAYLLGWELGSEPDSSSLWACDGAFNDIGYCNLRVDNLLKEGRGEMVQERRKAVYQEVQAVLAEDQPYIWLYFPNAIQGINTRVRGPVGGTAAGFYWNLENWWIAPTGG